jgi:hypothetical protein
MRLFRKTRSGQSAVELALMAPVLFTLLLAGRLFAGLLQEHRGCRCGPDRGAIRRTEIGNVGRHCRDSECGRQRRQRNRHNGVECNLIDLLHLHGFYCGRYLRRLRLHLSGNGKSLC